ncbi:PAS domain S-box protein [Natrinema sp. DC36]|uniref:PAS domain S-box protein n=1 Tax=Natrinema sp. DC36 TaxID=2878680 RepID=UPI001CF0582E|nr:PAS domain S-box protein [Natrinema sp. DC36]
MVGNAVCHGLLANVTTRSIAVLLGTIGVVVGLVSGIAPPDLATLGFGAATEPGLLVVGLAARSGSDGPTDIERLTDDLRQFISRIEDDPASFEPDRADESTDIDEAIDFAIDRDDEVGRLSEVIEDLTVAVRERERRRAESDRDRRDLYRVTSDPELRGEAKIRRLLELGCDRLGLETGLVSRIDEANDRYEVETAVGHEDELEGAVLDLSTIYCQDTIASDDILGIYDAEATGWESHPAADERGISCYLGGKIVVDGELYGTLCFLNRDSRDRPFTAAEKSFVDLMSRWMSQAVERRTYVRRIEERERRLERAQQFTDDMLDAVDDVVYLLDEDGEVLRWNESLREATGYTAAETESMHALDFFDETDHDRITSAIATVLETGSTRIDVPLVTSDGERIPYEFVGSALENPAGDRIIAGVGRDISERRDKERRLERYEQFTNDVLDALDDVFYILDEDGTFQRWNETLVEVSGYSDAEIESMDALDFFDEENRSPIRDSIEEAFETGETRVEAPLQTKSGEQIPYEFIASVLEDPDGRPVEVGIGRDITERRDKERRLREREARLERTTHLLEQSQRLAKIGAWELDVTEEPSALEWTAEVRRIHGVSEDEEIDLERALSFYHPDDRPRIRAAVERAIEDGEPYDLELRLATDDDNRQWVRAIGEPVFENEEGHSSDGRLQSGDGEIVKLRGSFQDISERKERERELERTETIIQALDELVYTIDSDGQFRFLNDALTPITGYEPEELIGEHVSTVMADGDLETARERIRDLLRADEPSRTFEMALETVHGDVLDAENHMALLPTVDGEFAGTAGVIRDITERKERERELQATSARLEALFENTPDMINVLDTEGTIVDANRTLSEELGYDADALIGTNIWEHDRLFDADEVVALLEELSVGERRKFEGEYQRRDGSTFPVEIHLICIDLENENRFIAISRDVTERKERERDLRETKRRLELALEGTNTGVWERDFESDAVVWNETLERLIGLEPGTFEGTLEAYRRRVHPDDVPRLEAAVDRAIENDELFQTEFRLRHEDGHWIWVGARGRLVSDEDGGRRLVGINNDITQRKERERELERTTELLKQAERLAGIGGWELDSSGDSQSVTLTDGLRRLYELPSDAVVGPELASSFPHSEDRPAVLETVDAALEHGEGYEIEHRMLTAEGNVRWVRSIGEPVWEDEEGRRPSSSRTQSDTDEIVGVRGTIQDITEDKEQELALESLHDAARDLLGTDTEREVAALVVETAADILEASGVAVYALNPDVNRFEPVAYTDEFATLCSGPPSVTVGDDDSVLWNAYVTETGTVVDDPASFDRSRVFGPAVESGVVVPIGDHGVFAVASTDGTIDTDARRLIETLVATTEAAFDRLESEASLRERESELEERNRRLNRQIEITELIRRIDQSLIGADGRAEIERTVPERLIEADDVAFAWIGQLDAGGTRLEPRAWAGTGQEYLDDVSLEGDTAEPAVRTARTETPTVVSNVVEGLQGDPWRRRAVDRGFQSVISVPLSHAEYSYGVLTVYADEPDAFGDLERTVMTELGEGIANAITAAKTREALHAETLLELTLRIEGSEDLLSRIAAKTGARVEYAGLGTHFGDETLLFFETSGVSPDDVRAVLDDLVSVTDSRLISDTDGDCRFEATVTGDVIASRLVRHGGSPRSMHADATGTEITVDVSTGTDVREFIEMLREGYPNVELRSRRHVERSMGTRTELVTSLFEALTDRQLEVLRTAYFAGFFEWPRESTGEEIAELLAVTQPTVNRHLRIGQQRLLAQLFEDEVPVPAE